MKSIFRLLVCFVFLTTFSGWGQNAIKQTKQQTRFFYTQLNLHGGYIHDLNGGRFDVTNRSPKNQLAFQFFSMNKKQMQKGYVKILSLNATQIRVSIPFNKTVNSLGNREADFKLQILDTWLKFSTKWDRTTLWIGNKSIPYGHNPKLDPVSSFMTNLIKMDIGFVQDLGVFLKTPISNNFDMELSITSGGVLNKHVLICDNLINDDNTQDLKPAFSLSNYAYENTWLVTSHIGNPTYRKNEFGINLVSGKIANTIIPNDFVQINRIGGDWVFKYYEKFKFTNQVTLGHTNSDKEGHFSSLHFQSSVDLFTKNRFFISTSYACNYLNSLSSDVYHLNMTSATSFTYSFSPHTRLRLNTYYSSIVEFEEKRWGVLLQFVVGIGKRP
ncbi:hypothetical protein [Crocinitomix catalasitica]|uniref:hypothetical protein n=1 Tax=Crocinitomix catalasitica TaxID=184607 RepID=UPI00048394D4|nr:hypothetical protein [Crocinitomix catalasitica]